MATDYYRPIANAIARLNPNTLTARRSIYDQARKLLFEEAQNSEPAMTVSELMAEQRALEDAIQTIEAEHIVGQSAAALASPPRKHAPTPRAKASQEQAPQERALKMETARERADDYAEQAAAAEAELAGEPVHEADSRPADRARPQGSQRARSDMRRPPRAGTRRPSDRARAGKQRAGFSQTLAIALGLFALFLVGAAAAYLTIYGSPFARSAAPKAELPPQKKEEVLRPQAEDTAKKARALLDQASRALEAGNPASAVQLLTESLVLSPNADAYTLRGHSYLQSGDPQRAIQDFSQAVKLGSRDFYAFVGRAVAYRRVGEFALSINDYNEAIKIRPDHAGAWNNRCFVQAIAGDLERALADCNESLRLMPNEPNALDSRALVYLKQGRWDQAIADYDTVLKLAPNTVSALYGRGFAKQKKGDRSGQADISTATTAAPTIAQEFERYGLK